MTAPTSRRAAIVVGALAVAHVVLAWLVRIPGLAWGEDDAAYIQLADQLRHGSYREVHDIAQPIHARFPPGFPLILAVFRALGGESVDATVLLLATCSAVSIVLLFDAVRRVFGEFVGVAAVALYALGPTAIFDSSHVMAEAAFKLLTIAGVWALTRENEGRVFAIVGGGAIIAAALTRSAGIVFVPALLLYWGTQRKWRHAAWFSVASLLVVAWIAWTFFAPDPSDRRLYTAQIGLRGEDVAPTSELVRLIARIPRRVYVLITDQVPTALGVPTVRGTTIDNALWAAAILGFGMSGVVVFWARWRVACFVTVAYVTLLAVYRHAIPRFVHPLVPLLFVAILVGVSWWSTRLGASKRGSLLLVLGLTLLCAAGQLRDNVTTLHSALACDRDDILNSPSCRTEHERAYLRLAQWVRDSTPTRAVFLASKERGFYYHSGRRTINNDRALKEDSASLGAHLRRLGATHAAVVQIGVFQAAHNDLIARACREFDLVRSFDEERALLLRVREQPAEEPTPTCQALRPWRRANAAAP